jgi:hypothetical protein
MPTVYRSGKTAFNFAKLAFASSFLNQETLISLRNNELKIKVKMNPVLI